MVQVGEALAGGGGAPGELTLAELERQQALGIDLTTLYRKLKRWRGEGDEG